MNYFREFLELLDTKGGHITILTVLLFALPLCTGDKYGPEVFGALLYSLRGNQK